MVRTHLDERYDIRALTRGPAPFPSTVVDLGDLEALTAALEGMDAVVHLAAASRVDSAWPDVLASNVIGTYHLFEAARQAGVPRVVFASSNHVVGTYEVEGAPDIYGRGADAALDAAAPPRPDSLYGVSKGFGELLGRYYSEHHGLRVICLRLGTVLPGDDPAGPVPPGVLPAQAAIWPRRIRDLGQPARLRAAGRPRPGGRRPVRRGLRHVGQPGPHLEPGGGDPPAGVRAARSRAGLSPGQGRVRVRIWAMRSA